LDVQLQSDLGLGQYVNPVDPTEAEHPTVWDTTLPNLPFVLSGIDSAREEHSGRAPPLSETTGAFSNKIIPTPIIDGRPDSARSEKLIAAHTPEMQPLVRTLVDNTRHVSFPEFVDTLQNAISDFNRKVTEPYVIYTDNFGPGKSIPWVMDIAGAVGLRRPDSTQSSATIREYLQGHSEIRDIAIIDDATYSGEQVSGMVATLNSWIDHDPELAHRGMNIHIVIPFATDQAIEKIQNKINPESSVSVDFSKHSRIETIGDIFSRLGLKGTELEKQLKEVYGEDGKRTLTYFDHKVADSWSVMNVHGYSFMDGPVVGKNGDVLKTIPFIPPIAEPYKGTFLIKMQNVANDDYWNSRIDRAKLPDSSVTSINDLFDEMVPDSSQDFDPAKFFK
jgi:hypothetical protein